MSTKKQSEMTSFYDALAPLFKESLNSNTKVGLCYIAEGLVESSVVELDEDDTVRKLYTRLSCGVWHRVGPTKKFSKFKPGELSRTAPDVDEIRANSINLMHQALQEAGMENNKDNRNEEHQEEKVVDEEFPLIAKNPSKDKITHTRHPDLQLLVEFIAAPVKCNLRAGKPINMVKAVEVWRREGEIPSCEGMDIDAVAARACKYLNAVNGPRRTYAKKADVTRSPGMSNQEETDFRTEGLALKALEDVRRLTGLGEKEVVQETKEEAPTLSQEDLIVSAVAPYDPNWCLTSYRLKHLTYHLSPIIRVLRENGILVNTNVIAQVWYDAGLNPMKTYRQTWVAVSSFLRKAIGKITEYSTVSRDGESKNAPGFPEVEERSVRIAELVIELVRKCEEADHEDQSVSEALPIAPDRPSQEFIQGANNALDAFLGTERGALEDFLDKMELEITAEVERKVTARGQVLSQRLDKLKTQLNEVEQTNDRLEGSSAKLKKTIETAQKTNRELLVRAGKAEDKVTALGKKIEGLKKNNGDLKTKIAELETSGGFGGLKLFSRFKKKPEDDPTSGNDAPASS